MKKRSKMISTKEFDEKFDKGEDVTEYLDIDNAVKRINVDFPIWVIKELDKESARLGISRQALIKIWVVEKLDGLKSKTKVA